MADCTRTHAEHAATWQTWRDDCTEPGGCGYAQHDPTQCGRGHPDDGVLFCGLCGHKSTCGRDDRCPDLVMCQLCPRSATYWRWRTDRLIARAARSDHLGYRREGT